MEKKKSTTLGPEAWKLGIKSGSLSIAHKLLAHTHSRRIWDGQDTSTTFFFSLFLFLLNYFNFLFKNWIIGCERIWFLNVFVGNIKKSAGWLRYIHINSCKKVCFAYFNIRISFFYFTYSLFKTAHIKLSILYYISLKCKIFLIFLKLFLFLYTLTIIIHSILYPQNIKK